MSPLWSNRLTVGLFSDGIRVRDGGASASVDSGAIFWPNAAGGEPNSWSQGVETLQRWIIEAASRRARLDIVISDHFARYFVLPWSSDLTSDDEWLALARARVDMTWGNGDSWEVRLDRPRFGSNRLACAMDQDLRRQLLSLKGSGGVAINSIQANFTATFNKLCPSVSGSLTLVVVAERTCVTIGSVEDYQWRQVRTLSLSNSDQQSLGRIIERERLLLGLPADVCVLQSLARDVPTQSAVGTH